MRQDAIENCPFTLVDTMPIFFHSFPPVFCTDVPSAMTQSVRQEHGTPRISSKSGRSMRCTEGSVMSPGRHP